MADLWGENELRRQGRLTGFLFLFVNALYITSLVLTSREIVPGDLAATARNLAEAEALYRTGAAVQALASALTILLAGAFYVLLRRISAGLALVALSCRVAEAALFGLFAILSFVALEIATSSGAAGPGQHDAWRLVLASQRTAGKIAQIYFCLGSAIFFYLLLKSRFIPRGISALVIAATLLSLMGVLGSLISPLHAQAFRLTGVLLLAAEAVAGLWLLLVGARAAEDRAEIPAPAL